MASLLAGPVCRAGAWCVGPCLSDLCCRCMTSGTVNTRYAARCVLLWLQAVSVALACILSSKGADWLTTACDILPTYGVEPLGVCACSTTTDEDKAECWSEQLVWRVEASAFVVFALLLLMSLSGCEKGAARSYEVAKFMAVLLLGAVSLVVPNSVFGIVGSIASYGNVVFLVVQSVLLIDLAYTWNEVWYAQALAAYRRDVDQRCYKTWLASILVSSAGIFFTGIGCAIHLYIAYPDTAGRAVNIIALILAVILLVFSVTDWVENGALLTSCVVTLYTVFMVWEMLAVVPSHDGPYVPVWIKLSILSISLVSMAQNAKSPGSSPAPAGPAATNPLQSAEMGQAAQSGGAAGASPAVQPAVAIEEGGAIDKNQFAIQCAIHVAASIYICASLAPKAGQVAFVFHAVAVIVSLLIYGWTLAAPKLLAGRDFS